MPNGTEGSVGLLAFAGSLRRASYNRALVRAAGRLAPEEVEFEVFDLSDIPLFDEDVEEEGFPEPVQAFQAAIQDADALLISTPEYQLGVPGVLKNALDWASRPPGEAAIVGKPVAIMGATPGLWGTARAQMQLRQVLVYNNCPMVMTPEVLVARADTRFDERGRLTHEPTQEFVTELVQNLVDLSLATRKKVLQTS